MTKPVKHLAIKLRCARLCANSFYAALLGMLTLWAFVRAPGFSWLLWLLACLPLLIFLPGLWQQRHRTYSWLCFVILLYFIKAVEGSLSSVASWLDFTILFLTIAIFISAMLTSRWLQRANLANLTDKESP